MCSYDNIKVIWGVSFRVEKGELVSLIGPNGAGKTTIAKTIMGLVRPSSGSVTFFGERIDSLKTSKIVELGVCLVPEGRQIFAAMSVFENLLMGAYTERGRAKTADSLEFVYSLFPVLKERKNQFAGTLSGGEAQMLAIARGLMSKPLLMIFDEPSLGLAPKLVSKVFDVIKQLRDEKLAMIMIEQNVYATLSICDRGYVLEQGKIVMENSGKELLNNERLKKAYLGM